MTEQNKAKIRETLELGKAEYKRWMPESPTHICGPDAGCDAQCADYYSAIQGLRKFDEALALLDAERPSECHWSGDEFTSDWYGDCGIEFTFIDGTPTENEMAYCPKCGGKLIDDGYPKQEDEDDEETP